MDKKRLVKGIWVVFGSMIMGLGIAVTLKANVGGVAPLSAFIEGISIKLDISMGWAAKLVMGLIVLVLLFIDRNRIGLGTLLNSFLVGSFVDYFMASNDLLYSQYMPVRFLWFAIGVVTMGIGIGLYISGGLGEAGIDSLMVLISEKNRSSRLSGKNCPGSVDDSCSSHSWRTGLYRDSHSHDCHRSHNRMDNTYVQEALELDDCI